jgi:NADP-dependent 3-hydroxy acid dehydrogenase YdfG
VVTGSSSGIGAAIARALMGSEASVCLVGRNSERLAQLASEASGAAAIAIPTDLARSNCAESVINTVTRGFGRLDILVHCAGIMELATMAGATGADLDRHFAVNVRAPYLLTQAALPMLARAEGEVVFVNSTIVRFPRAESGQYAATKSALNAVADSLRAEVNAQGVRVLTVFAGCTATPMQERRYRMEGRAGDYAPEQLLQPEDVAATVLHAIALPRTAEITDIFIRPMQPAP